MGEERRGLDEENCSLQKEVEELNCKITKFETCLEEERKMNAEEREKVNGKQRHLKKENSSLLTEIEDLKAKNVRKNLERKQLFDVYHYIEKENGKLVEEIKGK